MTRLARVVLATVGMIVMMASSASSSPSSPSTTAPSTSAGIAASSTTSTGDDSGSGPTSTVPTIGTQYVWVSAETVTTSTADDVNADLDAPRARSLVAAMDSYWSSQSNGAIRIAFGGFEARSLVSSSCNPSTIFADSPQLAFSGRFTNGSWVGTAQHLLVLTSESCANAGLGTIGGDGGVMLSGNGVDTSLSLPIALHEFGHNLGFGHAGSSMCRSMSVTDSANVADFGSLTSQCPTQEYGDFLDIMGSSNPGAVPQLSSAQRIRMGWLKDYADITSASGSVTTTIRSLGTSGTQAIRITDPVSGARYYVELRTPTGTDASSTEFTGTPSCWGTGGWTACSRGESASVRILREIPYRDHTQYVRTTVLAVGPTEQSTTRDTYFAAGDTFTAGGRGFYLRVNAIDPSGTASITVRFTPPTPTDTAILLGAGTQAYGTTQNVNAHVVRADGTRPTGSVTFASDARILGTVAVDTAGDATLPVLADLPAGKHTVTATYTPATGDDAASASPRARLTVVKAPSRVKLSLRTRSTKHSKAARATVRVNAAGVAGPSGSVRLYIDGKKVRSYSLHASAKGVLTITLPKIAKTGTRKIRVVYSGSSIATTSKSATARLRVR